MGKNPWSGKILTPGQIAQALERLGCVRIGETRTGVGAWKHPDGPQFPVSHEDCDDEQIEGIAKQIEIWANEKNRK